MRERVGPSTTAQRRPRLTRGIRRPRSHDYAWYTPPAANGGCSEFIKDFGIGFLIKGCGLANKGERPATILATQRPNTGRDYRVSGGKGQILRPNKINRLRLKAYYSVRCQANCKTVVVLSEIQSFRPGQGMSRSADPNGNFPARHAGSRGF